jgi:membrane-associated protease RseP (regulator of RpoE activity)
MASPERYIYEPERPTARVWVKHLLLLAATFCTATVAGTLYPFGGLGSISGDDPQNFGEFVQLLLSLPSAYLSMVGNAIHQIYTNAEYLRYGLSFSVSLLFILISHEMGHYVACRLYRVEATLPFFIPTPPMIGPAGTFGAFIKIKSPMPSRRAVFDIGIAGPIAGFIALLPVAIVGIATMETVPPSTVISPGALVFADPLLIKLVGAFFGVDLAYGIGNPFYFAAWVGLLVTALNLIPSGQLDGGHAIYAVLGANVHRWTGRIAFAIMAALTLVGWFYFNSPSGFLVTILLGVMLRVGHPEPWDQTPLDAKRKAIAFLALVIFVLCFVPFPIRIT